MFHCKKVYIFCLAAVCIVASGCSNPQSPVGMTVHITGSSNDEIILQATPINPFASGPSCCAGTPCITGRNVILGESGLAVVDKVVNPSNLHLFSSLSRCEGFQVVNECANATSIICFPPIGLSNFSGNITIYGPGVECIPMGGFRELCNNTWVFVNINGKEVSSQALSGSTSASVALDLANKINLDPDLTQIVFASVSGPTILVEAREAGPDYSYPWSMRYFYLQTSFSGPAFHGKLNPLAMLAPGPQ